MGRHSSLGSRPRDWVEQATRGNWEQQRPRSNCRCSDQQALSARGELSVLVQLLACIGSSHCDLDLSRMCDMFLLYLDTRALYVTLTKNHYYFCGPARVPSSSLLIDGWFVSTLNLTQAGQSSGAAVCRLVLQTMLPPTPLLACSARTFAVVSTVG